MKRIMTLVGAIIGVVFDAIFSLIMLIGIAAILELLGGEAGATLVAIVGILETALGVVALVFNAIAISGFACTHEKYAKKRGLLITAVVFNFVLAMLLLISLCTSFTALILFVFLASVAAGVLLIVDVCMESKRVAKVEAEKSETTEPSEQA
ncbi:MAG: hypothetical protein NC132_02230 [Corallococcus sp.]|nr:hypothetical protein [Corallococcus sp.]MCM1358927.1 hypothetical protein [Corallococcus sp.]MCM1394915.1 hypothetical protein [Corallococcus sp.]